MFEALTILVGLLLLALVLLEQRRYSGRRQRQERPTVCAWYIYRSGEDCTNPASPVYGQSCGPVCIGDLRCKVREVRR